MQPGHDGPQRRAHQVSDLAVRVALDVGQVKRGAEVGGQIANGVEYRRVGDLVESLGFSGTGSRVLLAMGLPVVVRVGAWRDGRLARALAAGVDEGGREDPVQPGAQVGARSELMKRGVRL